MPMYLLVFEDGLTHQTHEIDETDLDGVADGSLRVFRFEDDRFYEFTSDDVWEEVPQD